MHAGPDDRGGVGAPGRGVVGRVRIEVGHALRLVQQPLRFGDGVVAPDQHAQRARLLRARVGGQRVVPGDLEGGDLVVGVVEQLVIDLSGRGELVERGVDGRIVLPRAAFDRVEVTVQRGFDRLGGGTYLGSGRLRSIRHSADAIRTGAGPAQ
ncbi:hypothetical protein GCM10012285_49010 [Streptomyces kronopolitis]|uniref:Uncharacterized protein n=1 Tax=Streptomyces kronopolitis TaxID=1612435 RepID=A0ABQ2JWV0_9ACTN|nr:hypothetical protein GCM10012285_49010 [Streptomyces kronopolitis]